MQNSSQNDDDDEATHWKPSEAFIKKYGSYLILPGQVAPPVKMQSRAALRILAPEKQDLVPSWQERGPLSPRVKVQQFHRDEILKHIKRTGVTPDMIFIEYSKNMPEKLPYGLEISTILNCCRGTSTSIRERHRDFYREEYAKIPDASDISKNFARHAMAFKESNQISINLASSNGASNSFSENAAKYKPEDYNCISYQRIRVGQFHKNKIRQHIERTGVTPDMIFAEYSKTMPEKLPARLKTFTADGWMLGTSKFILKSHWDFYMEDYAKRPNVPDSSEDFTKQTVLKLEKFDQISIDPAPLATEENTILKTFSASAVEHKLRKGYVPITPEYLADMKAAIKNTGVSPSTFPIIRGETPAGLTRITILSWFYGNVKSARPAYLSHVKARYESFPKISQTQALSDSSSPAPV